MSREVGTAFGWRLSRGPVRIGTGRGSFVVIRHEARPPIGHVSVGLRAERARVLMSVWPYLRLNEADERVDLFPDEVPGGELLAARLA